jgi:hypothetical protein
MFKIKTPEAGKLNANSRSVLNLESVSVLKGKRVVDFLTKLLNADILHSIGGTTKCVPDLGEFL